MTRLLRQAQIGFLPDLRLLPCNLGSDKALLISDCALAGFVPCVDGESGDHAYGRLLGQEEYRRAPVRYLAHKTGVGVSNGWIEYSGLAALAPATKARLLRDIGSLR